MRWNTLKTRRERSLKRRLDNALNNTPRLLDCRASCTHWTVGDLKAESPPPLPSHSPCHAPCHAPPDWSRNCSSSNPLVPPSLQPLIPYPPISSSYPPSSCSWIFCSTLEKSWSRYTPCPSKNSFPDAQIFHLLPPRLPEVDWPPAGHRLERFGTVSKLILPGIQNFTHPIFWSWFFFNLLSLTNILIIRSSRLSIGKATYQFIIYCCL